MSSERQTALRYLRMDLRQYCTPFIRSTDALSVNGSSRVHFKLMRDGKSPEIYCQLEHVARQLGTDSIYDRRAESGCFMHRSPFRAEELARWRSRRVRWNVLDPCVTWWWEGWGVGGKCDFENLKEMSVILIREFFGIHKLVVFAWWAAQFWRICNGCE